MENDLISAYAIAVASGYLLTLVSKTKNSVKKLIVIITAVFLWSAGLAYSVLPGPQVILDFHSENLEIFWQAILTLVLEVVSILVYFFISMIPTIIPDSESSRSSNAQNILLTD